MARKINIDVTHGFGLNDGDFFAETRFDDAASGTDYSAESPAAAVGAAIIDLAKNGQLSGPVEIVVTVLSDYAAAVHNGDTTAVNPDAPDENGES
jgi:hypothetical protein